jgi:hypothetical protein
VLDPLLARRRARRWQRWAEVDPEDEWARLAGIGTGIAIVFFVLVFGMIIVGLVFLR